MIPTEQGDRYRCPFYGFYGSSELMILNEKPGSNACGLKVDCNSPCRMETEGNVPDWENCGLNNDGNSEALETIASDFSVYFAEGRSMPFVEWYEEVMDEREEED